MSVSLTTESWELSSERGAPVVTKGRLSGATEGRGRTAIASLTGESRRRVVWPSVVPGGRESSSRFRSADRDGTKHQSRKGRDQNEPHTESRRGHEQQDDVNDAKDEE